MQNNNIQTLIDHCLSKIGAFQDFPFGEDVLVLKIASKMFAAVSNRGNQANISLKCDPIHAEMLRQQYPVITPGYHFNKKHWNTIVVDGSISENELFEMINHSYDLVFKGLTKIERELIKY